MRDLLIFFYKQILKINRAKIARICKWSLTIDTIEAQAKTESFFAFSIISTKFSANQIVNLFLFLLYLVFKSEPILFMHLLVVPSEAEFSTSFDPQHHRAPFGSHFCAMSVFGVCLHLLVHVCSVQHALKLDQTVMRNW